MTSSSLVPDLWNLLHDGYVESIAGSVPGEIRLGISIGYLRERFRDPGERIDLILHECTEFAFAEAEGVESGASPSVPHRSPAGISPADSTALEDLGLEILSAQEAGKVSCFISRGVYGILFVSAVGYSLSLDSGREIALDELAEVAKAYWDDFGKRVGTGGGGDEGAC